MSDTETCPCGCADFVWGPMRYPVIPAPIQTLCAMAAPNHAGVPIVRSTPQTGKPVVAEFEYTRSLYRHVLCPVTQNLTGHRVGHPKGTKEKGGLSTQGQSTIKMYVMLSGIIEWHSHAMQTNMRNHTLRCGNALIEPRYLFLTVSSHQPCPRPPPQLFPHPPSP